MGISIRSISDNSLGIYLDGLYYYWYLNDGGLDRKPSRGEQEYFERISINGRTYKGVFYTPTANAYVTARDGMVAYRDKNDKLWNLVYRK